MVDGFSGVFDKEEKDVDIGVVDTEGDRGGVKLFCDPLKATFVFGILMALL